jgi:hypothetical protein
MTPLARELMRDMPYFGWADRKLFMAEFDETHFFECTAVEALIRLQGDQMEAAFSDAGRFNRRLAFLPAPKTWIEVVDPVQGRIALILDGHGNSSQGCDIHTISRSEQGDFRRWRLGDFLETQLPLIDSGGVPDRHQAAEQIRRNGKTSSRPLLAHFWVYAALAIINSPRIIGQRTHHPHERIERERLKALGLVGKFPLRAWTEIILRVALPEDRSGHPSNEAHLTGAKCLHYCRTHLRWNAGKLEYIPVEGHWRGNPALGIKPTRYRLEESAR